MNYMLPESLGVNGKEYEINSDYRVAIYTLQALSDPNLKNTEKAYIILYNIFCSWEEIPEEDIPEAVDQASWFLDGGEYYENTPQQAKPVIDWEQDQRIIISAVNKVLRKDIRTMDNMHWWSFLSFFAEIEDGPLAQYINIRRKKNKNEKLDKTEMKFYNEHKKEIDIQPRHSEQEKQEIKEDIEKLNQLLGLK